MIPAILIGRGGSVGLPKKNIMPVLGRPLMSYPLLAAKNCKLVDKIFGKRCKCINRKRETKTIFECIDCGKVLNG